MDANEDDILLFLLLDSADDDGSADGPVHDSSIKDLSKIQLIFQYLNIERSKYLLDKKRILQFNSKK